MVYTTIAYTPQVLEDRAPAGQPSCAIIGCIMQARPVFFIALLAGISALAVGDIERGFQTVQPAQIVWREVPNGLGARYAVLVGNDEGPGIYVVRVRFPPHVMDLPHSHPHARYVTVLEGTWYAGTGPGFDPKHATPLPAGSVMVHPAGGIHWDGSGGDEPVVVQIVGEGPGNSIPLDPKRPQFVHVDSGQLK